MRDFFFCFLSFFLYFPIFLQLSVLYSMKKLTKEIQCYSGCETLVLSVGTQGSPQACAGTARACVRPRRDTCDDRHVCHPHKGNNARGPEKDRAFAITYMDMDGSLMMNHRSLLSSFLPNAISSESGNSYILVPLSGKMSRWVVRHLPL